MIQQLNLRLKCQQENHKDDIDMVCYNQFCTEFRLTCFKCIQKGIHHAHINDVEKINSIVELIDNRNNECDNLIDELNTQIESVNQSFSQLKSGIRKKYQLLKSRLVHLNSQELNDFLNSIITFTEYKQSITKVISEQTKKLTHSFNNLYQQLQLSSINYYQIDDKNIKISKELQDKGYQLYWEDKYKQAIEILDQSISSDPYNHLSLRCKGLCLRELNQYEDAITWLDKALDVEPNHVDSLCGKGACLKLLNKYEEAITCLDKALSIDSTHVDSLCYKGECLRLMEKHNESIKLFDHALSIDQQHFSSLQNKGLCLEDQQQYKEALIYYQKSLNIDPKDEWTKSQIDFCKNKMKQ